MVTGRLTEAKLSKFIFKTRGGARLMKPDLVAGNPVKNG